VTGVTIALDVPLESRGDCAGATPRRVKGKRTRGRGGYRLTGVGVAVVAKEGVTAGDSRFLGGERVEAWPSH